MKTTGFGGGDAEGVLEFGVQDVEETVGETPEEEKDCDEGDGEDGLFDGEGGGTGEASVGDALTVLLVHGVNIGWAALVEDLNGVWLLFLAEGEHVDGSPFVFVSVFQVCR